MVRSLLLALASALTSQCLAQHIPDLDLSALRELASDIPRDVLESALHNHLAPKYRHGVFEHVTSALEVLHDQNPQLASALVDDAAAAKNDLKKRQETTRNATTVTSTSLTEITVSGSTSTTFVETSTIVSSPTGQSSSSSSSSSSSTSISSFSFSSSTSQGSTSPPSSTANPPATSSAPSPSSSPPTSAAPSSTSQTTSSAPSPSRSPTTLVPTGLITSSSLTFSATGTGTFTATDAHGSTTLVDYTPSSVVSEVVYSTSTLPGGAPVTVTSFSPTDGTETGSGSGDAQRTQGAQLQAGAGARSKALGHVWLIGAASMGFAVWLRM